ncbi:MAG: glycosyltransferase family 2 protein [Flavobacteriales bacterium]|nr:glycosyltransferase family 2 protein [Flavobacteriales bacterium]
MRISVIIPCYNVEAYLQRAIDSVVRQDHADLELICVNDGSTDGTSEALRRIAKDIRIPFVHIDQENAGACAARNTGIGHSTGEYIEFLDADDNLLPGKLSHQVRLIDEHEQPDLIVGSAVIRSVEGDIVRTEILREDGYDAWLALMRHELGGSPQNLWKRSAVLAAGGWSEGLGSSQEYDLMFRMLQCDARLTRDEAVLTEIHQRGGGSISQTNMDRNWRRFVELRVRIIEHLRSVHPRMDLQEHLQVLFDSLRTYYPFDPKAALQLYERHIPRNFSPTPSPATGKGYLLLHKLLGFSAANRLRQLLR